MSKNLNISFDNRCAFEINPPGVAFPAMVDGDIVRCLVTAEALEDCFGARGGNDALVGAFKDNRGQIEAVARTKIQDGERPVILTSDFQG